jgi:hypothetical protein
LLNDPNCNAFLHLAAQKLETQAVHLDIIGLTTPLSAEARLDLYVSDENEVVLSGNREGLDYLVDLVNRLKEEQPSEHFHADPGEGPLTRRSWPFVVYREETSWFDAQDSLADEGIGLPDRGALNPAEVVAVQFLDWPPAHLGLSAQKLYKVSIPSPTPVDPHPERLKRPPWEKHWEGGEPSRFHEFSLVGDSGKSVQVRLHLDDPGVLYFQRSDLANLL